MMDRTAQTERVIRAVSNPYTTILGHMTGRQLLRRSGYDIDIEKVLARARSTVLPLKSMPTHGVLTSTGAGMRRRYAMAA